MKKTKIFHSQEEYDRWTESFESPSDYQEIPSVIDDGWKISADMFTECKSWKTALKRFEKAFVPVNSEISGWVECMKESCENGFFSDLTGWKPAWTSDPEEVEEWAKEGTYSWGVEETSEGYWYIFLNISGSYAGRKRNMTVSEIRARIKEIDNVLDSDVSDEEFDRLEKEAQELTEKLGQMEIAEKLQTAPEIYEVDDWTDNFLSGFGIGTRKITNKQAEIFKKINNGEPFIYNRRRYDFDVNYRAGFGCLSVINI